MSRSSVLDGFGASGAVGAAWSLCGCASQATQSSSSIASASSASQSDASSIATVSAGVTIDSNAWHYDADNDVYYQIGVQYCSNPHAPKYESMGIYVPGAYFDAKENSDGTFACTPSSTGKIGEYTAKTAPVVIPVNTAGYSAQAAPSSYNAKNLGSYLKAGFVYVFAGCRGRSMSDEACGASPWGVTDLKAAIRTLRYNAAELPGDMDRIFSFGHSGGGAQSAVLGASGDAPGYDPYLSTIGAPTHDVNGNALSDAICGAMCWCPITCLTEADAAYEWNMGQFATSGTRAEGTFTHQLSRDLADSYANYINALGLVDGSGKTLMLEDGGEGISTSGAYYEHVKAQIEKSLNDFLADTEFPYTPSNSFNADMGAGGGGRDGSPSGAPSGMPSDGTPPDGLRGQSSSSAQSRGASSSTAGSESGSASSYETAAEYIAALNGENPWINYDDDAKTATITGLAGFVSACKSPSKSVGAFDALDRGQAENEVFGDESTNGLHFDATMASLLEKNASSYASLSNWNPSYPTDYANDRSFTDTQGTTCDARQNLYDPLYFLCDVFDGAKSASPAPHWRIRTGIKQGDTALTTEINLALAAQSNPAIEDVDFATVWGQGHTMAERTGSTTDNFIAWVKDCCK
ncbi:MAG: esterase [Eggerthellaceae bacterium]|nr:esterase [Eggerthellaceae bacterium]